MKNSEIRKLSAVTSAQVVPLGTRWREDKEWPQRLRKRAKASDELFISKDGVVVVSDLRVGFLAERIETVCISHANGYARWNVVAIYFDDIVHRFAVRATAWDKRPSFPNLDMSVREVSLVYHMCDILSRKRAFQENIYNIDRQISLDLVSNVHRAKELGKFDETRFIGLLTTDPLALPVLEATLFAAVWSEAVLEIRTAVHSELHAPQYAGCHGARVRCGTFSCG